MTLSQRIAALSAPDRVMDVAIELTRPDVLPHPNGLNDGYVLSGPNNAEHGGGQGYLAPCYTASIDAAVRLIPEDWQLRVITNHRARFQVHLIRRGRWDSVSADAQTECLARCAAALKARGL